LACTHHGGLRFAPNRRFLHEPRELTYAANALAVEFNDDISGLQTGLRCRTLFRNFFDHYAAWCRQLAVLCVRFFDVSDRDAYLTASTSKDLERPRRACSGLRVSRWQKRGPGPGRRNQRRCDGDAFPSIHK
jgi:hypothetical protein